MVDIYIIHVSRGNATQPHTPIALAQTVHGPSVSLAYTMEAMLVYRKWERNVIDRHHSTVSIQSYAYTDQGTQQPVEKPDAMSIQDAEMLSIMKEVEVEKNSRDDNTSYTFM